MMTVTPHLRNFHEQFPISDVYIVCTSTYRMQENIMQLLCIGVCIVHQCYRAVVRTSDRWIHLRTDGYKYKNS